MNTRYSIIALAAVAALSSCDSYLDELPDNRMELKSKEEVAKLLVSAYPTCCPQNLLEMYSDNTDEYINTSWTEGTRLQTEMWSWDDITQTTGDSPRYLWNHYYNAIASANTAIEYIEKQDDQSEYSAVLGEALLCRAYCAYKLGEVFLMAYDPATAATEQGLPYPTKPETTIGVTYERGTLQEYYEKIDADLQRGLSMVTNDYSAPKYHFTQNAAYAFACRFYLNYRDFDKAISYATKVLGSNPASKLRDWKSWSELSINNEVMTDDFVSSEKSCNLLLLPATTEWGALCGPYSYNEKYRHGRLLASYETIMSTGPWGTSDEVFGYMIFDAGSSFLCLRKTPYAFEFTDVQAGTGQPHTVMVEFSTDRLLMERAEAYALSGKYTEAVADINTEMTAFWINNRRTLTLDEIVSYYKSLRVYTPDIPTPRKEMNTTLVTDKETQEPLLQCILHLDRIMTLHEGSRMQYIKRYGLVSYRRSLNSSQEILSIKDTMEAGDPRLAIQLPADVINAGLPANRR